MRNQKLKYHFEGIRKNKKGKEVFCVSDLKTGKLLEWSKQTYEKNKKLVEVK